MLIRVWLSCRITSVGLANCLSLAHEDLFYLPQVIDIVPGKHAHDVFDRFRSALGMQPAEFPLFALERLE